MFTVNYNYVIKEKNKDSITSNAAQYAAPQNI